ncbi:TRAP transporter small permease [Pseudoprimorskyibacter insulae]|uniref:TRAP transporter small permease protein n=1 Tax=Pseudoprimorskyibacter insulae TaxID=1695997 RepID=A0A2R8B0W7_9RHOB|nr:TRAP transporter small permease [Pseudoprimorskyibacter insulae]SPF81739.1 hypothetical protein PRI8871_03564 [Pseudoprimorskyibacter insulae]
MSGTDHKLGAASVAPLPERVLTPIVWLGGALSAVLILGALALTGYSVFMRYILARPPVWVDDATGFLLVGLVMLGVAEAYRRGNHIAIDLLTDRLPPRAQPWRWVWSDLCVLAFSVVLTLSTWEAIHFSRSFGAYTSGSIEIEAWIPQLPMLAGAALLGLFATARLIGHLAKGAKT